MQLLYYSGDVSDNVVYTDALNYSETEQWESVVSDGVSTLMWATYTSLWVSMYDYYDELISVSSVSSTVSSNALVLDIDVENNTWCEATAFDNSLSASQVVFLPYTCQCVCKHTFGVTYTWFCNGYIALKSPELVAYNLEFFISPLVTGQTHISNIRDVDSESKFLSLCSNTDFSNGTLVYDGLISLSYDFNLYNCYYDTSTDMMLGPSDKYILACPDSIMLRASSYSETNYSTIWQTGYNSGYDEGYSIGLQQTGSGGVENFFEVLSGAFESVGSVLDTQVFFGMTVGTLIFIPLCFSLIMFIIDKIKS